MKIESNKEKLKIFLPITVVWLLLDFLTKRIANQYQLGQVFCVPAPGLIDFKLVHNTGGAWGMFDDMTVLLGIVSVLVCLAILIFIFAYKKVSRLSLVALSLVFAGGLGNAIDRFEFGYVIDFVSTSFIDFPVFNVADIGVTCGIILFVISILLVRDDDAGAVLPDQACNMKASDKSDHQSLDKDN